MSNLIPTPRTDKLGRTVIRHMREARPDAPALAGGIPAVSLRTPRQSHMDRGGALYESVCEFGTSLRFNRVDCIRLFHWLDQTNNPEVGQTVERVFYSGTETGKKLAAQSLKHMLDAVRENKYSDLIGRDKSFHLEMLELWNAGNLTEEVDCAEGFDFTYPSPIKIDDTEQESFSDAEWRGFAALRLAFDKNGAVSDGDHLAFIKWAGMRSDLNTVISIAKERRIMDPNTIETLIAGSGETPALREGVL